MTEARRPFQAKRSEIKAAQLVMLINEKDGKETDEFTKWLAEGAPPEKAPALPMKRRSS